MPIHGYPGNVITANPTAPTSSVASGVWTTEQQLIAKAAGNWPTLIPTQQISRSLRFNSADTAYLSRTPASAGNRRTWTWSCWIKGSAATSSMFSASNGSAGALYTRFGGNGGGIDIGQFNTVADFSLYTNAVTRDYSAWYHIVISADTTQATSTNRIKIYINSIEQTSLVGTYPTQNQDLFINSTNAHGIGRFENVGQYLNGYLTEVNFIDGQALTPSSFGQTNASTGVWEPIAYTGTYGTNGFYLNFSDNSNTTAATLGKDYSGNGNNWTPNNFSVTAGAGNDSLVDSPTSYGTDTGVGGEVRGNYCTWNSVGQYTLVNGSVTRSNGNLESTDGGSTYGLASFGTIAVTTGKWYWEVTLSSAGGTYASTGVVDLNSPLGSNIQTGIIYGANSGNKGSGYQVFSGSGSTAYGATYTTGDIIGVALDLDVGTITFYKNGVSQGVAFTGISGNYTPAVGDGQNSTSYTWTLNCGQRPFAYTAPSGHKALCTQNLPTPTIGATSTTQANKYFDVSLWTGNGSSQSITNSGAFQPDFVWIKNRTTTYSHNLVDAVRGSSKYLESNTTSAEGTDTGVVSAFNSNGFSVGSSPSVNNSTNAIVGWQWKANGAGGSNTAGTITSTVSANTTSGFSIVTYTGTGSNATVGHGIGTAPQMVICKNRSLSSEWYVYHASLGTNKAIFLEQTAAASTSNLWWNNTAPTSTVFSLGDQTGNNGSGNSIVAYCFAPVAGYSAFGSYTGNASADGPFIYTGFRPEFVMIKCSSTTGDWVMQDVARSPYNVSTNYLVANATTAEQTGQLLDFVSNGFKIRVAVSGAMNSSGATYIFMAFAENPFKYALAR